MKINKNSQSSQKGQALFIAMIFLLALTLLGFGLLTMSTFDIHASRNLRLSTEALYAAEEGMLVGSAFLQNMQPGTSTPWCGNTQIRNFTIDSESNVGYDDEISDIHYTVGIKYIGRGQKLVGWRKGKDGKNTTGTQDMSIYKITSTGTVNERSGNTNKHLRREVESYMMCTSSTIGN